MIPIQYSGAAYVNRLKPSSPSSVFLPRRVAAATPIQLPRMVASSVPVPTSRSVHGSASLISSQTGSPAALADPEVEPRRVTDVVGELADERFVEPVVLSGAA